MALAIDGTFVSKGVLSVILAAWNITAPDGAASATSMAIGRTLQEISDHGPEPLPAYLLHLPSVVTIAVWCMRYAPDACGGCRARTMTPPLTLSVCVAPAARHRVMICMLLVVLACCIGQPGPPTKAIYAHVTSKRVRADALINEGKYEEARYVRLAGQGGWESGHVRQQRWDTGRVRCKPQDGD